MIFIHLKCRTKHYWEWVMTAYSLPWHGVQKHKGHSEEWPLLFDMVPGSLSKWRSNLLIYIERNQRRSDLYPQKYPQAFLAGTFCHPDGRFSWSAISSTSAQWWAHGLGTQAVSTLMMKGPVYYADPRLYYPLVFVPIRWVRLSVPSCISYCAPCYFSFLRKLDH